MIGIPYTRSVPTSNDLSPSAAAAFVRYIADGLCSLPAVRSPQPADDYVAWLRASFPQAISSSLAPRQHAAWAWLRDLQHGQSTPACIQCVPRGGGKSTTAEIGAVYVGMRHTRRFVLYVSATQAQADIHVQAIATKLEALSVGRSLNRYGQSKGWTQQLLRTDHGFNVLSLGLDAAARGIKLDDYRPDLIILDDVDARHDSVTAVEKKIATITESILPAGSPDCTVLFVQNMIHAESVMARVLDGRADMLQDRMPPIMEPALQDFSHHQIMQPDGTIRYVLSGIPTWDGQSVAMCTEQANRWGLTAFRRESQHDVALHDNGIWNNGAHIDPFRVLPTQVPDLVRIGVAVDPPGGATECGIIGGGIDVRGHLYVLADRSCSGSPDVWEAAIADLVADLQADVVIGEANFGGDMVEAIIRRAMQRRGLHARYQAVHASRGKVLRAEPIQERSARGEIHHVGQFAALESEMASWEPGSRASPNRLDALVWLATALMTPPVPPAQTGPQRPQLIHQGVRR